MEQAFDSRANTFVFCHLTTNRHHLAILTAAAITAYPVGPAHFMLRARYRAF